MKAFWTVVIVIVVLAVLGYGGYRVVHHLTYKPPAQTVAMTKTTMKPKPTEAMAKPSSAMEENSVYKSATDAKLGTIMVDPKGMTLYTSSKDKEGVSNCTGGCLAAWPAYKAPSQTGTFPTNITVIKRSDGTLQYAWKGMPLYYFASDKNQGDVKGEGVAGQWSVVKL